MTRKRDGNGDHAVEDGPTEGAVNCIKLVSVSCTGRDPVNVSERGVRSLVEACPEMTEASHP
ncbi:hypothetical protein GCM10008957_55100 [Deinococcus ruber]|uniref:Uncharacterized protein n=1 Tax=Deinococcus ruber TaxID=1848197 RepID=A0A918FI46_9DEIO|nr:hypothetical protein GCM10008957_55100 [Deinococcus ruber]